MISVIVPVYNAEAYLDPCIESVLTQSYRNLELILINDGSTDNSLELCRRWEYDPRVIVLSTENRGVSAARNLGLDKANGVWILFLDSDDRLIEGCLERLMALVSPQTQEVIGAYTSDENANPVKACLHQTVPADSVRRMMLDPVNHRLMPDFYVVKPLSLPSCWGKLLRKDIIRANSIRFREELRLSEDTLFHLDYLACISDVTVTDLPVLYYRCNTASVTKVFHPGQLDNRLRFFTILKEQWDQDAAVHILSMLLYEICKIERCTTGNSRRQLEQTIIDYFTENKEVLHRTRGLDLSTGKWQRLAYRVAALCFRHSAYQVGFVWLRGYAAMTQGELNTLIGKEEKK